MRMLAFLTLGVAGQALAEPVEVPSGQPVDFVEMIWDAAGPAGLTYRFRFLAPEIAREGGSVDSLAAAGDMAHLCEAYALPRVASPGPVPGQIVISLADRLVPFGAAVPEATQYFEAYRPEDGACILEEF